MHHRPPRERTSPFGHYLRCTSSTVPCTPIHWTTVTPPCWLCLITPTLLTILYLSSAICIYSFILRYPSLLLSLFLLLFIFLFYLSLYYSISTAILFIPPILVIFTLFLYFYSLLFLSLFISIYTTLSTLAETRKFFYSALLE